MDNKDKLNSELQGIKDRTSNIINYLEGDERHKGAIDILKEDFNTLDKLQASKEIDPKHWDKFILFGLELKMKVEKFVEYISLLQVRYTSGKSNTKVLNRMLEEHSLASKKLTLTLPDGVSIFDNNKQITMHNIGKNVGYEIKDNKEKKDGTK